MADFHEAGFYDVGENVFVKNCVKSVCIRSDSVRMRENAEQNNSE